MSRLRSHVRANHGGAEQPRPPMILFLPVFTELPLTPKEDEHRWDTVEPDLERSFLAMVKSSGQAMSHGTQRKQPLFHADWMPKKLESQEEGGGEIRYPPLPQNKWTTRR